MSKPNIAVPPSEPIEYQLWLDTIVHLPETAQLPGVHPETMKRDPINESDSVTGPYERDKEAKLQDTVLRTAEPHSSQSRRMLSEAQVLDLLPFGRTTLNNLIKTGGFPRGTYVSPNRRAWFADQIARWQNAIEENNPHYNPHRGRGKGRRQRILLVKGS